MRTFCVYILANRPRGTLYVGSTSNLVRRVRQHKNKVFDGFTKKHRVDDLVWYEVHQNARSATLREGAIKEWKQIWKIKLIEDSNPDWRDLYPGITEFGLPATDDW